MPIRWIPLLILTLLPLACAHTGGAEAGANASPAMPQIVRSEARTTWVAPNGGIEVTILVESVEESAASSYVGYAVFHPGAAVPEHNHPDSDEYLYFLSGRGTGMVGGNTVAIEPGMALFIPRGMPHAFANDGSEDVVAVQVYTPSGPEQRFKQWNPKGAAK